MSIPHGLSKGRIPSTQHAPSAPSAPIARRRGGFEALIFPIFMLTIIALLAFGWVYRDTKTINAESGLGYWLGVLGMGCVGLLLIYPVRKRLPKLAFMGSVPMWFHFHMALGLVAPTLILFHAGFRTGSINATVALTAMLVVAGSGVLGRMLYVRVHRGLSGQKSEIRTLTAVATRLRATLVADFADVSEVAERLERSLHAPRSSVFSAFFYAASASSRIATARHRMLAAVRRGSSRVASTGPSGRRTGKILRREASRLVRTYCQTLQNAAYLTFFERLFALWHIMHLPLFFLMLVAAAIHIVAVHLY